MQIVKQKRNYWRIEPGTTADPYATIEKVSGYDVDGHWQHGWHIRLRAPNGMVTGNGGCHQTRDAAVTAACTLLDR